ncbi:MAG: HD domain-containing protein [Clostridiales bacterium]|nr:HD domain-containing protein [Clostridiales bacterium]
MIVKEDAFSVFEIATGISEAIDLVSAELNDHHKKVAYISYHIAKEMNLPDEEINDIVLAAILHDIGAFTCEERLHVVFALFNDNDYNKHPEMGFKLLRNFEPFHNAALLIRQHHAHFDKDSNDAPIGSYIVHLADRVSIIIDKRNEILGQVPGIIEKIDHNRAIFHPDTLAAFRRVAKKEYFWIETCFLPINNILLDRMQFPAQILGLDALLSLAKVISQIIDFRSRFTSTHSSGVAAVAFELTGIHGFSERECKLMKIAGYLHDIGKLAISNDILEKNGALNHEEFNEMRKHPYFTYAILNRIKGFEQIAMWAASHHERLDGNGYPFHVRGENFSKLSRIMAVADIVTAITEDRPYRKGMDGEKAIEILSKMVEDGGIDKGTVEVVKENFARVNDVRMKAQEEELQEYNAFYAFSLSKQK